ncbi:saccharopine dehydrogenase C-terminal domain-containing protein [Paludibacterium paludis]|uniref:Homospermidine synthase n=1 Tax=Paludibacterium paludis TaxID=1225769 RepID=A0A918P230_9NEIS|nr:saccharopine dehydrogenase C-terminal domain-containing protein [Paludibacterium paludis]GGY11273.1 homospermidine synthase [Paludibacterium paludis]
MELIQRIVIIGLGNIGQGILPLLDKHFPGCDIVAFEPCPTPEARKAAAQFKVKLFEQRIARDNYQPLLTPWLEEGSYLLNLATSVSSTDLIRLAQRSQALYLDTCIEPWEYDHGTAGIATTNYQLRESMLELQRTSQGGSTAIVAHGANPGFVSVLMKRGLIAMARASGQPCPQPETPSEWAQLARHLGIRVIQISERDTQITRRTRAEDEFLNTWSVEGLVTECLQPAELGWGSHEPFLPVGGRRHDDGCGAAIMIDQPAHTLKVRSWSPNFLDFEAFLITHNEAVSIADYLTLRDDRGDVLYRPTSYYAYHPCDDAVASMRLLEDGTTDGIHASHVIKDEIVSGIDELGVFLISDRHPALWIGSNLSIGKARKMAVCNNATSLQVVSSIIAGMQWMHDHPRAGVVESEALDHDFVYRIVEPYWAPIIEQSVTWFPDPADRQLHFEKFLVAREASPRPAAADREALTL